MTPSSRTLSAASPQCEHPRRLFLPEQHVNSAFRKWRTPIMRPISSRMQTGAAPEGNSARAKREMLVGTDLEDLGPARRAQALRCRTAVLHDNRLRVLDLALFLALHAITFFGSHLTAHLHLHDGSYNPKPPPRGKSPFEITLPIRKCTGIPRFVNINYQACPSRHAFPRPQR